MTIHHLPGNHIHLSCDTPGCAFEGPTMQDATEDELLDRATDAGWNIESELGLHYCPLTTLHDCDVCGAPTRSGVNVEGTWTYYCREHWPT